jgi:hypothetical protein
MLEILKNFEQAAAGFAPLVLIVPGLVILAVGLFVWLGGLGFKRLLVGLVGAISGVIFGFYLLRRNFIATTISTTAAILVAIIFERLFIAIILAALATVLGFVVLAGPYIDSDVAVDTASQGLILNPDSDMSVRESIETMKAYVISFSDIVKQASSQMPAYRWVIVAALAVIFLVAGFWLRRFASAFCFAVLGTLLVFVGMILLLSYKGSAPVSKIANRSLFYAIVFIAMVTFGTFEQLLLLRRKKGQSTRKKQTSKEKQESEGIRHWRTT